MPDKLIKIFPISILKTSSVVKSSGRAMLPRDHFRVILTDKIPLKIKMLFWKNVYKQNVNTNDF